MVFMSTAPDVNILLKSLGLTVYEIKTFKALLEASSLTADQIHVVTDIPTPRIYDTIDSLEKKGLVRVIPGRPKKFECIDPNIGLDNFLSQLKEEYEKDLDKITKTTNTLKTVLGNSYYESHYKIQPDELLQAYSSLDEMQSKTSNIIENAKEEVCIFTNVFYWFDEVKVAIEKVLSRSVSVRVIMSMLDSKSKKIASLLAQMGASVRELPEDSFSIRGTLVDQEQVVFVIWVTPKSDEKFIYRPHFSSNPGIIELFYNNFEYLWNKGD